MVQKRRWGTMIEIRLTDQYDDKQIVFKAIANLNRPSEVRSLFAAARDKGLDIPKEFWEPEVANPELRKLL